MAGGYLDGDRVGGAYLRNNAVFQQQGRFSAKTRSHRRVDSFYGSLQFVSTGTPATSSAVTASPLMQAWSAYSTSVDREWGARAD